MSENALMIKWSSNTRHWAIVGNITIRVEFSGGTWSWMVAENEDEQDERIIEGGNSLSAAAAKKAAQRSLAKAKP